MNEMRNLASLTLKIGRKKACLYGFFLIFLSAKCIKTTKEEEKGSKMLKLLINLRAFKY